MNTYTNTDQQLHLLCQTIAKANRTFVPKKEDDSHTNLSFNASENRIEGRWIDTAKQRIILSLNLSTLDFEWINESDKILESFPTINNTIEAIENKIGSKLEELGLNPKGFTEPLHFEIPTYEFAKYPVKPISKEAITDWMTFRKMANEACESLLSRLKFDAEIRIWPHHFDTGIYVEPSAKVGLGFGLAMEDSLVGDPYFYYSAYGLNGHDFEYPSNEKLKVGKWILNENWKGAVLSLSDLQKTDIQKVNKFEVEVSQYYL